MARRIPRELEDKIVELYKRHQSIKKVSKELGASYNAIRRTLYSRGVIEPKPTKLSKEAIEKLIKMAKRGVKSKVIAEKLGISKTTVFMYLSRYNISLNATGMRDKPLVKIPKEEWKIAYLAGIVDGEGTIDIREKKGVYNIRIHNTSRELIEWLKNEFGGLVTGDHDKRNRRFGYKKSYIWISSRAIDTFNLLKALYPFLIVKKERAKKGLEILSRKFPPDLGGKM